MAVTALNFLDTARSISVRFPGRASAGTVDLVLRGEGCRARLSPGPWLRLSPLQLLLLSHVSLPHGGVMGRTWAFLPLG